MVITIVIIIIKIIINNFNVILLSYTLINKIITKSCFRIHLKYLSAIENKRKY